jgi:hypothetical protein
MKVTWFTPTCRDPVRYRYIQAHSKVQCVKLVNIVKSVTRTPCTGGCSLTLRLPNEIPFVIRVILVTGKVFTHKCDTIKLYALIQC